MFGNGMQEHIYLHCHHFSRSLADCVLSDVYNKSDPDFYDFYYSEDILCKFCLIFGHSPSERLEICNKSFFEFTAHTNAFLSIPSSFYQLLIVRYFSHFFPSEFNQSNPYKPHLLTKSEIILLRDPQRQNIKNYQSEFDRMLSSCDRNKLVSWKKKLDRRIYQLLLNENVSIQYLSNSNVRIASIVQTEGHEPYLSILKALYIRKYVESKALRSKYNVKARGLVDLKKENFYKALEDTLKLEHDAFAQGKLLFVRGNFDFSLSEFDVTSERGSHSFAPYIWGALLTDIKASVGGYYGNTIFYRSIDPLIGFDFMYVHPAITVPIIDFFRSGELTHDRFKTVLQKSSTSDDEYIYKLFPFVTVSASNKWFYEFDKSKNCKFYVDESGIIGRKISPASFSRIHRNYLLNFIKNNASNFPTERNEINVLRTVLSPFFDEFKGGIIEKRYEDEPFEELSS